MQVQLICDVNVSVKSVDAMGDWSLRTTEEVIARGDVGDCDAVLAVREDELVDCPEPVLVRVGEELRPYWAGAVGGCGRDVDLD